MALNIEYMEDLTEMFGIELMVIDKKTTISEFKKELRYNEVYYQLSN
jgi:L-arabinose isomerase